jgi:hypothetical protein
VVDGDGSGSLSVSVGLSSKSYLYAIDGILNAAEIMNLNNLMGSLVGSACRVHYEELARGKYGCFGSFGC